MEAAALIQKVLSLQSGVTEMSEETDCPTVVVDVDSLLPLSRDLCEMPELAFDQLTDHTSVDWLKENRFELLYRLYSLQHGHGLLISCSVPRDSPVVPSLSGIWPIAEWQEREVYDLMGILYADHPDLRRLYLDDDWQGFPLRKEYKDDYILEPKK